MSISIKGWIIISAIVITLIIAVTLMVIYIPKSSNNDPTPTTTIIIPTVTVIPTITIIPTITPPIDREVTILTRNILNAFVCMGTDYSWNNRKSFVADVFKTFQPDVFFLQEATQAIVSGQTLSSVDYIADQMLSLGYDFVPGKIRENSSQVQDGSKECVPMYWNTTRVTCLTNVQGMYSNLGCSGEPDEDFYRTYTYGKFELVGQSIQFYAFGTHFSKKQCPSLQELDAKELQGVIESVMAIDPLPYFVVADFNNGGTFKADEYLATSLNMTIAFNGPTHFDLDKNACDYVAPVVPGGTLDHILYKTSTIVGPTQVLPGDMQLKGLTVPSSDHSGVFAKFDI